MEVQGKIVGFEPDFSLHKPKLILELTRQDNLGDFSEIKDDKLLDIKITRHREKRSLQANAYCWELISKISELIGSTKEDVYREYIRQKGIYKAISINNDAVNTFIHLWKEKGLGWICDVFENDDKETTLYAYYGSSSYNTKQMSDFIDYIVQEAKGLGIPTETPDEIARMKSMWVPKV